MLEAKSKNSHNKSKYIFCATAGTAVAATVFASEQTHKHCDHNRQRKYDGEHCQLACGTASQTRCDSKLKAPIYSQYLVHSCYRTKLQRESQDSSLKLEP